MNALTDSNVNIEYDTETNDYYIVWEPLVIGAGKTEGAALEDLRAAALFGVDALIDLKLKDIIKED
jgi:predicted RNase H-like HicB family nuclease